MFINGAWQDGFWDDHSGLVPPDPIPNSEVKQACVSGCTALRAGSLIRCPSYFHLYLSGAICSLMYLNGAVYVVSCLIPLILQ